MQKPWAAQILILWLLPVFIKLLCPTTYKGDSFAWFACPAQLKSHRALADYKINFSISCRFQRHPGMTSQQECTRPCQSHLKTCGLQKTAEGCLLSMPSPVFIRHLHATVLSLWTQISVNIKFDIGFYPVVDIRHFSWRASQQEALEQTSTCITYSRYGRGGQHHRLTKTLFIIHQDEDCQYEAI